MEFVKASDLPFNPREQIAKIFAEGFYEHGLSSFSKDKAKLAKAFAHSFVLNSFYVAVEGEEIMSLVGCTDKKPPPLQMDKKFLIKELGFIRGRIAYWGVNKFVVNKPYPFEMLPQEGSIEFVAAASEHKGKGATYGLLSYVMEASPFNSHVLEVIDHNEPAIKLYEKLGFREFKRVAGPRGSGIKEFVYMRKAKERAICHEYKYGNN